jgi:hypothetical protein
MKKSLLTMVGCLTAAIALSTNFAAQAQPIVVDGVRDAAYGPTPDAVQGVDSSWGAENTLANMSVVQQGTKLFIFIGAAVDGLAKNQILLFVDSGVASGTGVNVFTTATEEASFDAAQINNMGLDATTGMTLPAGFTADYVLKATGLESETGGGGWINLHNIGAPSGQQHQYLGQASTWNPSVNGVVVASYIAYTDPNTVPAAAGGGLVAVDRGLEIELDLTSMGVAGASSSSTVKIMAILSNENSLEAGNQVLASLPSIYDPSAALPQNLGALNLVNWPTLMTTQSFSPVISEPVDNANLAPVITVSGATPVAQVLNGTYVDPGATAVDPEDGSVPVTINSSAVNTAVPGVYLVTFNAVDSQGVAATQKTRKVVVYDPAAGFASQYTSMAVPGGFSGWSVTGEADPSNAMQLVGNFLWELEYVFGTDIVEAPSEYKIAANGDWTDNWGAGGTFGGANATTAGVVTQAGLYRFQLDETGNSGTGAGSLTFVAAGATITVNGPALVAATVGSTYTDLGATATASNGSNITGSIVTTGLPVDTAAAGTYTVTYEVTDPATTITTSATRRVVVYDPAAGFASQYNSMAVPGGFSDWNVAGTATPSNAMELVANFKWRLNYVFSSTATAYNYKIAANGDWADQWGAGGVKGANDANTGTTSGGGPFTNGPGLYKFELDEVTNLGSLTFVASGATITVTGNTLVAAALNSAYTDLGATAVASDSANITGSIVTTGLPINTSVAGTYTVTYTVTDPPTGIETSATRKVLVYDPAAGFASQYSSIAVPGAYNSWNVSGAPGLPTATPLAKVADFVWQSVAYFSTAQSGGYKFAANGDWADAWGAGGVYGAGDASFNGVITQPGFYTFTLNEVSNLASVTYAARSSWAASYGLDPAGNGAPTADPDGDGYDNNLEFAFGTNPTVGTPALLSATRSGANVSVSFLRLIGSASATYTVQTSSNLATGPWTPTGITPTTAGVDQTGVPAGYERVSFTAVASGNAFYRVVATVSAQ